MDLEIQMPIRDGGHVPSWILERFLFQDVAFSLRFCCGPDTAEKVESARIKREHLRANIRPYPDKFVWLADDNVAIPAYKILPHFIDAMNAWPPLGALAGMYFHDHIACGALLMRSQDYAALSPLRSTPCECMDIQQQLQDLGLLTLANYGDVFEHVDITEHRNKIQLDAGTTCAAVDLPGPTCVYSLDGSYLETLIAEHGSFDLQFPAFKQAYFSL